MYINALTQKPFSESNCKELEKAARANGFSDTEVAGYQQWRKLGRIVAKGEKGTKIVKPGPQTEKGQGYFRKAVFFKSQTVNLKSGKDESKTP